MLIRQQVRGKKRDTVVAEAAALMLIAQITDIHLGFEPGNPDELNRQRLDTTLRTPRARWCPGPICCSPPATWPTPATTSISYARLKDAVAGLPFPVYLRARQP